KKLGERLWMPVISRDEIKEGYVNTYGVKHDQLPPDANALVSELFFIIVNQYLAGHISVVIEAAFQHNVWEPRMPEILELACAWIVLCSADGAVAARLSSRTRLGESKAGVFSRRQTCCSLPGNRRDFTSRKLYGAEIQSTHNSSLDRWRIPPLH